MVPVMLEVVAPTTAIYTNLLHWYLFFGSAAGIIVGGYMVFNIARNRAKHVKEAPKFHEEERPWGSVRTVLLTLAVTGSVLAFVEYETFASVGLYTPPSTSGDPMTINVTGEQFVWIFTYPNGYTSFRNLIVPQNEIIYLNVTSKDVDHSLSIATLDVARDALPGQYNLIWFNATQPGTFVNDIRCKELCGVGHASMIGNFTVMSQSAFNAWYASVTTTTTSSTSSSSSSSGPTATVIIPSGAGTGLNFSPNALSVAAGTTIIFVNQDTSVHNVHFLTMPSGANISPNPSPNTTSWTNNQFTVTLTTPGTYTVVCDYHNWMRMTITVTGS